MHVKRNTIQKFWPVPRKGTKYIARASHEKTEGIPLIVVMRDVLKLVKSKKELQKLINEKKVEINGKLIRDVKYPVMLFDSLSFKDINKYYKAVLKGKRVGFEEIDEKKAGSRIYKVIKKRQIKDKKIQLNLNNGKNILSSEKIKTGDFIVLSNKDGKIIQTISLGHDSDVIVVDGKHIGKQGKIKEIAKKGENDIAVILTEEGEIKVDVDSLFAKW